MTHLDWMYVAMFALIIVSGILMILGYKYLGADKMDKILTYVKQVVLFIEQTMRGASGPDKLSEAQKIIVRDCKLDANTARIYIEAAVKSLFNMDRK